MKIRQRKAVLGVRAARMAEMEGHRLSWLESGLSRAAYASGHGLAVATFTWWMRRLAQEKTDAAGLSRRGRPAPWTRKGAGRRPPLVPVRIVMPEPQDSREGQGVEVEFTSGTRLCVPAGYPLEYLSGLLALLEPKAC